MALTFEPRVPWHLIVTGLSLAVVLLMTARGLVGETRWRTFGRHHGTRWATFLFSVGAATLFALAAWNPYLARTANPPGVHLVVALDVSDSVLRAEGGWPHIQAELSRWLLASVRALPAEVKEGGVASVLTFGKNVVVAQRAIPLEELPAAFDRLSERDLAAGGESDLAAALLRASDLIAQTGGQGAVLLASDGNQTTGNAEEAARQLAREGIPVYVLPIEGGNPALAITAANLSRQVNADTPTYTRGLLGNNTESETMASFGIYQNYGQLDPGSLFGSEQFAENSVSLAPQTFGRFHEQIVFQGIGLQYLDLWLRPDDGSGEHRRRFFTHVYRPPRILAIGGDNRWTNAFSPEAGAIITAIPDEITPAFNFLTYDAIVISDIAANLFPSGTLEAIARTVEQDGLGLIVINGGHHVADELAPTVLMSYVDTPLDPLLPVSAEPRPEFPEPLPRQVVILIDASGSMSGQRLTKAKEIARYIVENLLRPVDRLDLMTFNCSTQHLVKDKYVEIEELDNIVNQINSIQSGGGTCPDQALAQIASRKMSNCGLIFISDGEFSGITYRPDCRSTVFAIGQDHILPNSPLYALADPFPVGSGFDPTDITIPYFKPEPRDKFFEPGDFTPLTMEYFSTRVDTLPVPELSLPGAAITYIKQEADLIAVRPKFTDPVLAYKASGAGYVGVLTSEIPPDWAEDEAGRQAVEAWITRVISYAARDRYDFLLTDHGEVIEVRIAVLSQEGVPRINQLTAHVEIEGQPPIVIPLTADPLVPATFTGFMHLPRKDTAQSAYLLLRETGPDALSRPQRIPFLIPPSGDVLGALPQEMYSFGLNEALLRAITETSGGVFNPPEGTPLFRGRPLEHRSDPLWPALMAAGALAYVAAIALVRFDS